MFRRALLTLLAVVGVAMAVLAPSGSAQAQAVSRDQAIDQLQEVRRSIDHTLALIKAGHADEAFKAARDGYLQHFELVEIPLRAVDNGLTIERRGQVRRDPPG